MLNDKKLIRFKQKFELLIFYGAIFIKHLAEKKLLITFLIIVSIGLYFLNNTCSQTLLGVTISALVTVVFLDSINQFVAEKNFLNITQTIRTRIYSIIYTYIDIIFLLNRTNITPEIRKSFAEQSNLIQLAKNLRPYCENNNIKNNSDLSEQESSYANQYLRKLKESVDLALYEVAHCPSNIEIYSVFFPLSALWHDLKNKEKDFFSNKPGTITALFGGINESFIKNSLQNYMSVLEILENNKPLSTLRKILKKEFLAILEIPEIKTEK